MLNGPHAVCAAWRRQGSFYKNGAPRANAVGLALIYHTGQSKFSFQSNKFKVVFERIVHRKEIICALDFFLGGKQPLFHCA